MDFQVSRTLLGPKVWMAQLSGPNVFPFLVETFPVFSLNFFPFWGVWFLERATKKTPQKKIGSCHNACITVLCIFCRNPLQNDTISTVSRPFKQKWCVFRPCFCPFPKDCDSSHPNCPTALPTDAPCPLVLRLKSRNGVFSVNSHGDHMGQPLLT